MATPRSARTAMAVVADDVAASPFADCGRAVVACGAWAVAADGSTRAKAAATIAVARDTMGRSSLTFDAGSTTSRRRWLKPVCAENSTDAAENSTAGVRRGRAM